MRKLCSLSRHFRHTELDRAVADPDRNIHVSRFSFAPTWGRTLPVKLARVWGAVAALGLVVLAPISPSHAQAPPLGTAASYAILAGTTVTNVPGSASVINGNLGVYPGNTCPGFSNLACGATGLGLVTGTVNLANTPAQTAQADFFNAYGVLAGDARTATLTGQDLGGKTLVAGVYFFSSTAQLTGTLTLNGQGNPNSVFIFQIGSKLTTGSGSAVVLSGLAQGGNVFWQVGSQA